MKDSYKITEASTCWVASPELFPLVGTNVICHLVMFGCAGPRYLYGTDPVCMHPDINVIVYERFESERFPQENRHDIRFPRLATHILWFNLVPTLVCCTPYKLIFRSSGWSWPKKGSFGIAKKYAINLQELNLLSPWWRGRMPSSQTKYRTA